MKAISRTVRRIALLLAVAMLVTMQKIPVQAQGAENGGAVKIMDSGSIHNPSYDSSKNRVTWSTVEFGSYPQTEVKGSALTSAIIEASYDSNGDAWVNGVRYHRIGKNDTNDANNYGDYTYRFFKWEDIQWYVLKMDGDTVFLAATQGLDCKSYHSTNSSVTWADCSLRSWLNNTFLNTAFSATEKDAIVRQNIANNDNSIYGTSGGKATQDYVYLLSGDDMTNSQYGFRQSQWEKNSGFRQMEYSEYAYVMGVYQHKDEPDYCWYWLRTPGKSANQAIQVTCGGWLDSEFDVTDSTGAVLPALTVKRSAIDPGYDPGHPAPDSGSSVLYVSDPQDKTVKTGEKVTFEVKANGDGKNTYKIQWYSAPSATATGTKVNNGSSGINPATARLTVTASPEDDGKYYYCVVSDSKSSKTSARAKLTVYYPPTVSVVPSSLAVEIGEEKPLNVQVEGGNPNSFTYRWYQAESASGEGTKLEFSKSSLVVAPDDTSLDGLYLYCVVSNGQYDVASNRVRITVGSESGPTPSEPSGERLDQEITYSASKIKNGKVVYGTKPFSLKAESSGNGGLSFASSNGSVLSVDSAGRVTVKGYGKTTITITAAATSDYNRASRMIDLTVVPKKVEITSAVYNYENEKAYFKWKKDSTVSGYQCSYAFNRSFTKKESKKLMKGQSVKLPKSNAIMYVRIRAYKKVGGKTYYGDWSDTRTIKPKS